MQTLKVKQNEEGRTHPLGTAGQDSWPAQLLGDMKAKGY